MKKELKEINLILENQKANFNIHSNSAFALHHKTLERQV